MSADPAFALADHVKCATFASLPATTVAATRRDILDTFGCMLGGSGAPGIPELTRVLLRWGGAAECQVLLSDTLLPAPYAALLHGSMGHALDYDDTLDHGGSGHLGVSTLAAALAAAELQGQTSGRDLVLAVTLGLDVSCRVALAATVDRGWHRTAAMGIFGATAAAGKLLGLNAAQLVDALGIAYSHAAGNRQCILDGALTKRLQAGQAASSAIVAALLAREGFTGAHNVFAGRYGFFEMYQPGGYDLRPLTDGLGTAFRGDELSFKPYPCGRPLHAALDAALALRDALDLRRAEDIAEIAVALDTATYTDQFEGGPHKRHPTQIVEAQFALPFLLAVALLRGRVGIGEVSRFEEADVRTLAELVRGTAEPGKPRDWARLRITHADGRAAERETTIPLGAPANPLGDAQLAAKFLDCAAHAARPVPQVAAKRALAFIERLEAQEDATALLRLLPGTAAAGAA